MSRFKTVAPVMLYIESKELAALKSFAKVNRTTMSQVARDGIRMRMSGSEDPYNKGFNDGLAMAMDLAKKTKGAQMMFPSGKSFAELVCDEIEKHVRESNGRYNGNPKKQEHFTDKDNGSESGEGDSHFT